MEILVDDVVVSSSNDIEVGLPAAIDVTKEKEDYEVKVAKREYTIIGDSIFIPTIYNEAPPWLKDLLDRTIAVAVDKRDQSIVDRMEAILTAVEFVPMNQYSEQIYQIIGEDGIINQRIAALNSNLTDAINSTNATIATINSTYVTKEEAGSIASNVVIASISESGEIGSKIVDLQEAYATFSASTAQELEVLEASFKEYSSSTIMELESVRAAVDGVDAKFSYDSNLKLNGTTYTSGYGLATSLTENSGIPVGSSEFWIKADKFRLVSSSGIKSSYSPFSVDATTGDINFNGKVSFENIAGGFDPAAIINANTTTIDGGKITTNSISASKISSYNLTSSNATIGNAVIDTAHIKNLSVGTEKIGDNAISSTVTAKTRNAVAPIDYEVPSTDIVSVTVPSSIVAGVVLLNFSTVISSSRSDFGQYTRSHFRILNVTQNTILYSNWNSATGAAITHGANAGCYISISCVDINPSTGPNLYKVDYTSTSASTGTAAGHITDCRQSVLTATRLKK